MVVVSGPDRWTFLYFSFSSYTYLKRHTRYFVATLLFFSYPMLNLRSFSFFNFYHTMGNLRSNVHKAFSCVQGLVHERRATKRNKYRTKRRVSGHCSCWWWCGRYMLCWCLDFIRILLLQSLRSSWLRALGIISWSCSSIP